MTTTDDLETLSRALLAVTQQTETREVLQMIVETARSLVEADYAALGIPDESGWFSDFYAAGVTDEEWRAIGPSPRAHGLLGRILNDPGPRRLSDVRSDPEFSFWPEAHPNLGPFLATPVVDRGVVLGMVYVANRAGGAQFGSGAEQRLGILANHAAIALTRARQFERERELTLLDERSRIARDLHDAVTQKLFSLRLTMSAATALAETGTPDRLRAELQIGQDLAAAALDELRAVVAELRPPALREDGLVSALRKHVAVIGRAFDVELRFESDCDGRCALSDLVEQTVFRIAQEAVHNAVRHATPSRVDVELRTEPDHVVLIVHDDGTGFEVDPAIRGGHHLGIVSMKERARDAGGRLRVRSNEDDGTTVRLEVPR